MSVFTLKFFVSFASWRGGGVAVEDDTPADLPADETGRRRRRGLGLAVASS